MVVANSKSKRVTFMPYRVRRRNTNVATVNFNLSSVKCQSKRSDITHNVYNISLSLEWSLCTLFIWREFHSFDFRVYVARGVGNFKIHFHSFSCQSPSVVFTNLPMSEERTSNLVCSLFFGRCFRTQRAVWRYLSLK